MRSSCDLIRRYDSVTVLLFIVKMVLLLWMAVGNTALCISQIMLSFRPLLCLPFESTRDEKKTGSFHEYYNIVVCLCKSVRCSNQARPGQGGTPGGRAFPKLARVNAYIPTYVPRGSCVMAFPKYDPGCCRQRFPSIERPGKLLLRRPKTQLLFCRQR